MIVAHIYILIDPRNGLVRYIGKTIRPSERYSHHIRAINEHNRKNNWIKSLLSVGCKPIMQIIDTVSISEWKFWECHYISLFKSWGFDLTNLSDGGQGAESTTIESRVKMRNSALGKKHSQATKDKISLAGLTRIRPQAEINKKKQIASILGRTGKKPVFRYDLENHLIKSYESLRQVKEDGFNSIYVSKKVKDKTPHKGFIWKLS